MNRLFSSKPLLAAAVAIGALGAATAAQARSDVVLSIGLNAPVGYVQPATVYVQPAPVYYGNTYPTYYRNGAWGDADRDGIPNIYDRYNNNRHHGARGPNGDADRDGVPNRYDREPNNPYRR